MKSLILLSLLLYVTGCGDRTGAGAATDPSNRTAALLPELRIDGWTEELVPIAALAVSSDGVIAFTQAQDGQVRFYAASGKPLGRLGRRGEGPGEFLNPYRLGWVADTLWVYDGRQRRISFVTPERTVARTLGNIPGAALPRPEDAGRVPEFPFAFVSGIAPDGSFLASMGFAVNQPVPEEYRGRSVVGLLDQGGTVQEILSILPEEEGGSLTTPEGGSASVPFGNRPQVAFSPRGEMVAFAMASLDGPDAGTFLLTAISPAGDSIFSRRYELLLEPIPASVSDSARTALIDRLQRVGPSFVAAARDAFIPGHYPPLEGLVIGMDGTLWVQKRPMAAGVPYLATEPNGEVIGALVLPGRSRIAAAQRDRIWVIERDSLNVESVVRYAVSW